jgi:hypothetical protein
MTLHFASGASLDPSTNSAALTDGYNLADVQDASTVNALPDGTKALVWLNESSGVTQSFIDKVTPLLNNNKVFGFYLTDEPDPTGQYNTLVKASDLKAESDWIHTNFPGAKTFITTMNMGSSQSPNYANTYNYANTHIDLFGVAAYPVWSDTASSPDYGMIDRNVQAAVASGIEASRIVPEVQAFGGGSWVTENGTPYATPTASQGQAMLNEWAKVDPNPVFDYTYAWGSQQGDTALGQNAALQAVFAAHNSASGTTTTGTAGAVTGTSGTGTGSTTTTTGGTPTTGGTTATGSTGTSTTGTSGTTASSTDGTGTGTTTTTTSTHHHHHASTSATSGTVAGSTTTTAAIPQSSVSTAPTAPVPTSSTSNTAASVPMPSPTVTSSDPSSTTSASSALPSFNWGPETAFAGSNHTGSLTTVGHMSAGTSSTDALSTGNPTGTQTVLSSTAPGDHDLGVVRSGGTLSSLSSHWTS